MRQEREDREIRPDAELGAMLRRVEGEVPAEEVDWGALRASIRERAALPLARRRRIPPRRLLWPLVPLTAAASIALALWLGGGEGTSPEAQRVAGEPRFSVEEALSADISEQEFRLLVSGRANPDALLLLAVSGE